jgi:hypothetical protein
MSNAGSDHPSLPFLQKTTQALFYPFLTPIANLHHFLICALSFCLLPFGWFI